MENLLPIDLEGGLCVAIDIFNCNVRIVSVKLYIFFLNYYYLKNDETSKPFRSL